MKPLKGVWFWLLLVLTGRWRMVLSQNEFFSFTRLAGGFEPYHTVAGLIRTELASQMAEPVDFFEASLESARFTSLEQESPLLEYLQAQFASHNLDLVVPIGGPAAQFVQRHRQQLFQETAMLTAVDQRLFNPNSLTAKARILRGESPGSIRIPPQKVGPPQFDWGEF